MSPADIETLSAHCVDIPIRTLKSGVYLLILDGVVVYVGTSYDVDRRIDQHRDGGSKSFDRAMYLPLPEVVHSAYEGALIRAFQPRYNKWAPQNAEHDAEILDGLDIGHLAGRHWHEHLKSRRLRVAQ